MTLDIVKMLPYLGSLSAAVVGWCHVGGGEEGLECFVPMRKFYPCFANTTSLSKHSGCFLQCYLRRSLRFT